MIIKILGSGCRKCQTLEQNVREALREIAIVGDIEKVTDVVDMARYGIMSTPGLVIDEKVVATGRVLNSSEIVRILKASGA